MLNNFILIENGYKNIGLATDIETFKSAIHELRSHEYNANFFLTSGYAQVEREGVYIRIWYLNGNCERIRGHNFELGIIKGEYDRPYISLVRLATRLGKNPMVIEL